MELEALSHSLQLHSAVFLAAAHLLLRVQEPHLLLHISLFLGVPAAMLSALPSIRLASSFLFPMTAVRQARSYASSVGRPWVGDHFQYRVSISKCSLQEISGPVLSASYHRTRCPTRHWTPSGIFFPIAYPPLTPCKALGKNGETSSKAAALCGKAFPMIGRRRFEVSKPDAQKISLTSH